MQTLSPEQTKDRAVSKRHREILLPLRKPLSLRPFAGRTPTSSNESEVSQGKMHVRSTQQSVHSNQLSFPLCLIRIVRCLLQDLPRRRILRVRKPVQFPAREQGRAGGPTGQTGRGVLEEEGQRCREKAGGYPAAVGVWPRQRNRSG